MEIIIKKIKNSDLIPGLLPMLMGNIFHVTSIDNLKSIEKDGCIEPNFQNKYQYNTLQSKENWGTKNKFVCMIDLRNPYEKYIDEEELLSCGWYFLKPNSWNPVVFLILDEGCAREVKTQEDFSPNKDGKKEYWSGTFLPHIEVWYPESLPLSKIKKVLIIEVVDIPEELFFLDY